MADQARPAALAELLPKSTKPRAGLFARPDQEEEDMSMLMSTDLEFRRQNKKRRVEPNTSKDLDKDERPSDTAPKHMAEKAKQKKVKRKATEYVHYGGLDGTDDDDSYDDPDHQQSPDFTESEASDDEDKIETKGHRSRSRIMKGADTRTNKRNTAKKTNDESEDEEEQDISKKSQQVKRQMRYSEKYPSDCESLDGIVHEDEELYKEAETERHNRQTKRRKTLYKSLVDGSLTEKDAYKVDKADEIWMSTYRRYI